ncbi:MAG: hypothetical protein IT208_18265 [Chthonomonadales bacterium]|nr:hypothetical protein [Chthonomonadales bacterium]
MPGPDLDPPPDERDALIDRIATAIVRRRLETPAILFLEMHKPLAFIAGQGLIVTSPFIAPFVGVGNLRAATALLQDRANVERLIVRIEELAADADAACRAADGKGTSDAPRG